MDRIIAKSKRGGSAGGKRRKEVELGTEEEETGLSIKEKLKVDKTGMSIKEKEKIDKKRKAESQEVQDSPPKKRMRVS